jgi:hypothetical protein
MKLPKVLLALNMCLLWTSCAILSDYRGARWDWSCPRGVLECVNGLWHFHIFDLIWSYMIWSLILFDPFISGPLFYIWILHCSQYGCSLVPDMDIPSL